MTAEEVYVDPSALTLLYLHQPRSREMVLWRHKISGVLPVTHHGRSEVVNAISQAAFRQSIDLETAKQAQDDFAADFTNGHLEQADILWRGALNHAMTLSRQFTPKLGTRSLDVLHVACALELKLRYFLSFDEKQQKLAAECKLKLVKL